MHKHHAGLRETLGTCRAYVVLINFIQHEASKQARIGGNTHQQTKQDGQGCIGADIFPVVVTPSLNWKPTQAISQHVLPQDDEDQNTDGHERREHHHGASINRRSSNPRKAHSQNQSHECFYQEQGRHQGQGRRQTRCKNICNRFTRCPTVAKVEGGYLFDKNPQLNHEWLIQSQFSTDAVNLFLA